MINLKKKHQAMIAGGAKLAQILSQLIKQAQPGITPLKLNQIAEIAIKEAGATPSFTTVGDYRWAICYNYDQGVVHGIPNSTPLKAGQLASIDIGLIFRGFHVDMSESFIIPGADPVPNGKIKNHLLTAGRAVLSQAIQAAKAGRRVGHISQVIENGFAQYHLNVVRNLTGHAIGRNLHQDPMIPQYLSRPIRQTAKLTAGMTLAIEVIYTPGDGDIVLGADNWTLSTKDNTLSGLFERTIIVTKSGGKIVTPLSPLG